MSKIQAVIFDKLIWSNKEAQLWLNQHKLKPIKGVHITKNYRRYRIMEPNYKYNYITYDINNGIKLIIEVKFKKNK